ncbi:MAG: sigma-70 family RNA polymerase sigma factor, partial [Clostridia bacterium]
MITGIMLLIGQLLFMTSYVKDNVAFPMPLSKEDEEKFIKLSQKGDENAKKQLINHNLRLVVHIAKKYSNYPDQDELISVGSLGLIKAINSFTLEKGTALATYASRCIENEILMAMRGYKKRQNDVSI